jgi:hypothetical protein
MYSDDVFWKASLEEMKKGYYYDAKSDLFVCLICGKSYEKGIIYQFNDLYAEAEKAILQHIKDEHSSVFEFLLNMDKKYTGLTDNQKNLLMLFYKGCNDKKVVEMTGAGSTSTIRNHRFTFREKEKQAKIFLSIMELLNENISAERSKSGEELIQIHRSAAMVDERYAITEAERDSVIKAQFDENNRLKKFPIKQKKKIIVLQYVMKSFERSRDYTEKEVNEILKSFYSDYVTIRRYLIEYAFMDRTTDCNKYWVK